MIYDYYIISSQYLHNKKEKEQSKNRKLDYSNNEKWIKLIIYVKQSLPKF